MDREYNKTDADSREYYGINLQRSLILSLLVLIIAVYIRPRVGVKDEDTSPPVFIIDVEQIPMTRQAIRRPPPPRPRIPVPSDKETIPEEETIEETTLKHNIFFDFDSPPDFSGAYMSPPKPVAWVFPKYPKEDRRDGVRGEVKLSIHVDERGKVIEVIVLSNSTGSKNCEKAAIDAAYDSRFIPAKEGDKTVSQWVTQSYTFDLQD